MNKATIQSGFLAILLLAGCGGGSTPHDSGVTLCDTDDQCPIGWTCVDGICERGTDGGIECVTDADCDDGEFCDLGLCAPGDRDGGTDGGDAGEGNPDIEVEPAEVDFGNGRIGQAVEQQILIRNAGGRTLTVFSLTLEAGSSGEFGVEPLGTLNQSLLPGHDLPLVVRYLPQDGLADDGALLISSDDPEEALVRVPLSSSYKGASEITLVEDPAADGPDVALVDFGPVAVGGQAIRTLFVKNTGRGNDVLAVDDVRTEPISSVRFDVEAAPSLPAFLSPDLGPCLDHQDCRAGHTCVGGACVDGQGVVQGAVTLTIRFTPEDAGPMQEGLVVTNDEDDGAGDGDERTLVIQLRGEGIQPGVEVTPDPVDFGAWFVGQEATLPVVMRNSGGELLLIDTVTLDDGADPFRFDDGDPLPWELAPGEEATVVLRYAPLAPGGHQDALAIGSNAPDSPRRVGVLGSAVLAPVIEVSPASLDFSEVQLGEVASGFLTVTNTGGSDLEVDVIGLAAGSAAALAVVQTALQPVAPGASARIDVVYAPVAPVGADTGAVEIASNDPASTLLAVPVSGLGTDPTAEAEPPAVDFGSIYVGFEAGPVMLAVRNTGFGTLTVTAAGMNTGSNPDFELRSLPPLPRDLGSGETLEAELYFTPIVSGPRSGAVRVLTSDRDAPLLTVQVTGAGSDCPQGWWDINGDPGDGCEYPCDLTHGGVEDCDGVDNDCDADTDEGLASRTCYATNTWGTCAGSESCDGPNGWVGCDAPVPAEEVCDGADNDCDGAMDALDNTLKLAACETQAGACLGSVHRAALCQGGGWQPCEAIDYLADPDYGAEICDDVDNDCDADTDAGCDDDGDGWCDAALPFVGAPAVCPAGPGDCDDQDASVHPGQPETCLSAHDDDCDGDDNDPGADGCTDFFFDQDGDGWGIDSSECRCNPIGLFTAPSSGDCDDANAGFHPGAAEVCGNSTDEDCSGALDDKDVDEDGYVDDLPACGGDDCDDSNPLVNPAAAEAQDTVDNDCDGYVDEGLVPAGAVIVTEIMYRPDVVSGEYFEVTNVWSQTVNLHSFLMRDDDVDSHGIFSPAGIRIAPGETVVLCAESDPGINGGVDCDYDWTGYFLGNGGDEVVLELDGVQIDRVAYDNAPPWPNLDGVSLNLDPNAYEAALNDLGENWCRTPEEAAYELPGGDHGTPGDLNPTCSGELAVLTVEPGSGIDAGGETIEIRGAGFTGANAVTIGTLACQSFQVLTDGRIECVTPAQPSGDYDVTVTRGVSVKTLVDGYRYTAEATAADIDWAVIQHPDAASVPAGVATSLIFGQVYQDGVTPVPGPPPGILAQVGFGPQGSDPRSTPGWLWFDAVWNPDCVSCNNGQNDEFMRSLIVADPGSYNYAYRFSGDSGFTFLYADLHPGTTDGFSASDLGALTVQ